MVFLRWTNAHINTLSSLHTHSYNLSSVFFFLLFFFQLRSSLTLHDRLHAYMEYFHSLTWVFIFITQFWSSWYDTRQCCARISSYQYLMSHKYRRRIKFRKREREEGREKYRVVNLRFGQIPRYSSIHIAIWRMHMTGDIFLFIQFNKHVALYSIKVDFLHLTLANCKEPDIKSKPITGMCKMGEKKQMWTRQYHGI